MALMMRAELARPGMQFVSEEQYNQLFTMHGTIMLLLFATPLFVGVRQRDHAAADRLARRRVPAAEHARATGSSCSAASIVIAGFLTPGGAAAFGWFAYAPLSDAIYSPGVGADLWIMGLALGGFGTILGARQLHHHDLLHARARHDDVPDADLHLEHPAHQRPRADGLPGAGRGAARRSRPTASSARTSSTRPTAARSCGSTCSGSSAIPRSTSSRCRSSASSPRSCRSSAASRSSATRAWSSRPSRSPACR